jgi:hypothetical protein
MSRNILVAPGADAVVSDVATAFAGGSGPGPFDGGGLDDGRAGDVDNLIDGGSRIFDQLDHGEQKLAVANEEIGENAAVALCDGLIV